MFVALDAQLVEGTRRIILSPVAYLAVPYFPTLFHKGYDLLTTKSVNLIFV